MSSLSRPLVTIYFPFIKLHAWFFVPFFDEHMVVLLWSKTLRVAFVGYVESGFYVVDFYRKTTSSALCLFAKGDTGWLWHRRRARVNMRTLQSLHKGGHILSLKEDVSFCKYRVCRACVRGKMHGAPHKAKTTISTTWCFSMLISSVHRLMKVLEKRSIASSSSMTIHVIVGYSSWSTRVRLHGPWWILPTKFNVSMTPWSSQ
jgi:hypothetical protein